MRNPEERYRVRCRDSARFSGWHGHERPRIHSHFTVSVRRISVHCLVLGMVSCAVVARPGIRACRQKRDPCPRCCSGNIAGGKAVREDNVRPSLLARSRPSISCEFPQMARRV